MSLGDDDFERGLLPTRPRQLTPISPISADIPKIRNPKLVSEARFCFESLDFQDVENEVLKEHRVAEAKEHGLNRRRWFLTRVLAEADYKRYFLLMVIGLLTGTVAFLIDKSLDVITSKKWEWVGDQMKTDAANPTIPFVTPFFMFIGMNVVLGVVAAFFVVHVEPLAAGSGIPEVKCYLNGVRIYRIARLRTLIAKAVGIVFSVASGLPCGREGPMIHSGAIIGGGLATGKSSKLHWDTGFFKEFRGDRDKRLFITAGAAAGVAAAFGAPIGAVLFAVEEVGSFWNLSMAVQVFLSASFSVLALNMCTKFSDPLAPASGQTNFGVVTGQYHIWELPFCVVLGALGGLLGALFNYLNISLTKWRKNVLIKGVVWRRYVEVAVIALCVSTVLFSLTARWFVCRPESELPNNGIDTITGDDYKRTYGCNETNGEFNNMATLYFDQIEANIRHMFHAESTIDYYTLFAHFIPYFALTIMTYGIAVPSGLFLPCLALGSSVGRIYGQVLAKITGASLAYGSYACFGSAAVLAGVVRMTVSLSVIVMESTGNSTFTIPLMLATCTAKFVGDMFNKGIYDEHIHLQRVPLLEQELEDEGETEVPVNLSVAEDVMNESDLALLPVHPTVETVLRTLRDKPYHQAFMVTETGEPDEVLRGIVLRRYLLILLRKQAWGLNANSLKYEDFVKSAHERELLKLQKYCLTLPVADREERLNLERYMDAFPVTVKRSTPLPRVFRIFRDLGLRHLVVVSNNGHPAGVISRKGLVYLKDESWFDNAEDNVRRSGAGSINMAYQVRRHPSAETLPDLAH